MSSNLRRALIIAGITVGVGLIGGLAFSLVRSRSIVVGQDQPDYRTGIVERGNLREVISVTGSVQAREHSDLAFLLPGKLDMIYVDVGQPVKAGDPLMKLDVSRFELDLLDAQLAVELQQIALDELLAGPDKFDVVAARAAVGQAYAQLEQISQPPDEETVEIAHQSLELSRNELWRRQAFRDQVRLQYGSGAPVDAAEKDIESAELGVRIAEQQLINAQQGVSSYDIAVARASVAQAQATLNRLLEGPTEIDVELGRLQIKQAQLALQSARLSLENAVLDAPFAGTVAEVDYRVGEQVAPGLPALVLIDDAAFHVDVMVDEIDVARVKEGQLAFLQLDAWPDAQVSGHITRIAPDGISIAGVVSYQVRVKIDATDVPIRDGMTSTVDIVVTELTDVLLVPNWAVRFDRRTNEAFVNIRRPDGTIEEIKIEVGVRGETMSEVRQGLKEDDEVVVSLQREEINVFEE